MDIIGSSRIQSIYNYSILAVVILLPWSLRLCTFALILMCILGLLSNTVSEKKALLKSKIELWPFIVLYLIFIIGLLYTSNFSEGLFDLEKRVAFLAVPLVIGSSVKTSKRTLTWSLKGFVISNLAVSLIFLAITIHKTLTNSTSPDVNFDINTLNNFLTSNPGINTTWLNFSYIALGSSELGPTIQSVFLSYCIAILLTLEKPILKNRIVRWAVILWFTLFIVLLASRIGFIILSVVFVLSTLLKYRISFSSLIIVLLFALLTPLLILLFPVSKFRLITEPVNSEFPPKSSNEWNSINIRQLTWASGIEAIKDNWLIGAGTGGGQTALKEKYKNYDLGIYQKDYTTHNQFLFTLLENGLLGIVALLACFILPSRFALSDANWLLGSLVITIFILCLTNSFLEKSLCIMFFTLFCSLFVSSEVKKV